MIELIIIGILIWLNIQLKEIYCEFQRPIVYDYLSKTGNAPKIHMMWKILNKIENLLIVFLVILAVREGIIIYLALR